jgi:hypothetical protein
MKRLTHGLASRTDGLAKGTTTEPVARPNTVRHVGLDVHVETIAVAEADGTVRELGVICHRPERADYRSVRAAVI